MQSIDTKGFDDLDDALARILTQAPGKRREFHEEMADLTKGDLDAAIASSGLSDAAGKVRRWQVAHVGSGGGYAAVRAAGGKEGAEIGLNGPGAITNYLEGGHQIRTPSGRAKRYRPRIRVAYVNGYHFYETAFSQVEGRAIEKAEAWVDDILKELG